MTVPTDAAQPPRDSYIEDGATLVHAINFTFEDQTEITVNRILVDGTEILLVNPTHYTVTGGAGGVGSITKTNAGVVGATIQIDRNTPRNQLADYEPGDDFPAEEHEGALDKLTRIAQELARDMLSRADVRAIVGALLVQGEGITISINADGTAIEISSSIDVYSILKSTLAEGAGVTITADDVLERITITAESLENLPDCVELSGDQQTFTGGESGGAPISTADVIAIIQATLEHGAGINLVADGDKIQIVNTSLAGYTDENARDAIGTALRNGTLINIVVDDAGDTITINCTALDPSYRGLAVIPEAGAFDFVDSQGGRSILYTGGAAAATLRLDATHALSDGWGTVVRNKGTGPITLAFDAGVSIMVNGSVVAATSISLAIGAVATLNRWGANDFTLNGNSKVSST